MTTTIASARRLSDQELLTHIQRAAADERGATVHLVALLMELDTRRLYLAEGYSSLFAYCIDVLHLSEHAAYGRIGAARAARRFPVILERLAEGTITLTAISLVSPLLTATNHLEVLDAAKHKRKSEIEHLVARLRPKADVPATIRKLPERKPPVAIKQPNLETPRESSSIAAAQPASQSMRASLAVPANRPAEVKALAPERYKIQFTVSRETYERLRYARDLLRHTIPNGDPGAIFERALEALIDELEKNKLAAAKRPRTSYPVRSRSRHIPASVKRAVWRRDGGRCAFKGTSGRCEETGFLEFHHVVPFAAGGETTTKNVELRCRAHNAYEAEKFFRPREAPLLRETRDRYGAETATRSRPSCAIANGSVCFLDDARIMSRNRRGHR